MAWFFGDREEQQRLMDAMMDLREKQVAEIQASVEASRARLADIKERWRPTQFADGGGI